MLFRSKSGIYELSYISVIGMTPEALVKMNIPQGQGRLPDPNSSELEFYFGNHILEQFMNPKNYNDSYWMTGKMPDIDLMNDTMFVRCV